ncbi:PWWP domain-containing protein 2B [Callorhinchus milii]|uniref:PWWP domain containing 2B n=1 Tax=Callorhinchus milii TaxID=7868 RepID=V9KHD8_CALMI|nr:PWWP domain-containing protein 2B [Callorhinchus milii]XP_007894453.1 PWWP domain-containing protein 2B [Callorhinchus milii]|eukprot:gi/632936325/ref/XP_007894452.1/ PREDICTED: PWWP domain-containing protein 2B [Callorhinchus milii]
MAALSPQPGSQAGLRVGAQLSVTVQHIISGTLVVSTSLGGDSYTGILIDMAKRTGLYGVLPNNFLKQDHFPVEAYTHGVIVDKEPIQTVSQPSIVESRKMSGEGQVPNLQPLPGVVPCFTPYYEGASLPQPLLLRQTYHQWVPQPPLRIIKRTKRRLSRNRDPGKLTLSTIRLRPRQVLCEKCKNTLNADEEEDKDAQNGKNEEKEKSKNEAMGCENRKLKREKRDDDDFHGEVVHRSPVIKISYSTPQGKGKVVKIPSRVHGSVEPFCPKRLMENGREDQGKNKNSLSDEDVEVFPENTSSNLPGTIPKLKLTRPLHSNADIPPPRIRLKPQRLSNGDSFAIYKAELVDNVNCGVERARRSSDALHSEDSIGKSSMESTSGSSGEDHWKSKRRRRSKDQVSDLTVYLSYRKKRADSSSLSVCSNDSLDESKSSSSEMTSPEICDFAPGDDASVSSSSKEEKTVPPLTVRLHTKTVTKCVTPEGRTISVGDIIWGKIHGFPWWPARILSINVSKKENGAPLWQEARVSWFGSPTTSLLSVSKISPFLDYFKLRFNKKKKGVYRKAITEAAKAAEHLTPEIQSLLTQFET